jgi:hypothetical protein
LTMRAWEVKGLPFPARRDVHTPRAVRAVGIDVDGSSVGDPSSPARGRSHDGSRPRGGSDVGQCLSI